MQKKVTSLSSRMSWVDICRGFAILFVMYGHAMTADSYRYVFYAFHIPLFFFLSGVVFKDSFTTLWSFIKKSFKSIMIPYFMFAVLTYFFWFAKEHTTHNTMQEFLKQVFGILYGNGTNGYLYFNVALWFLPCLFVTRVGFAALTKLHVSKKSSILILGALSIIGYLLASYTSWKLPLEIETAFSAIVFFGAGFLIKENATILSFLKKYGWWIFISGLAITIILATVSYQMYGTQIDMRMNRLHNYVLFYIPAFCGILAWVSLSLIWHSNRLLEFIGQNTLILFVWHYLLYSYFSDILFAVASKESIQSIQFAIPLLYTILATCIILMINKIRLDLLKSWSRK